MYFMKYAVLLFAMTGWLGSIQAADKQSTFEMAISLTEYIAKDYGEAVEHRAGDQLNGHVKNQDEYNEMQTFARDVQSLYERLKTSSLSPEKARQIEFQLATLQKTIQNKQTHQVVIAQAGMVKELLVSSFDFARYPMEHPIFEVGKFLYRAKACAGCHGDLGKGDGPIGANLVPPAKNFHEDINKQLANPFGYYTVIKNGVSGTSMIGYGLQEKGQDPILTTAEMWSLAFYLFDLVRDPAPQGSLKESQKAALLAKASMEVFATLSDEQLIGWLKNNVESYDNRPEAWLKEIRSRLSYSPTLPLRQPKKVSFDLRLEFITQAVKDTYEQLQAGNSLKAQDLLLKAYLQGFEPIERVLKVNNRDLVTQVEKQFFSLRGMAAKGEFLAFRSQEKDLQRSLVQVAQALKADEAPKSYMGDFIASALIILREGMEAFLVITALLALVTNLGLRRARKWIHLGWVSALLLGVATYYLLFVYIELSGFQRESIEAVCGGIATLLLFYTGFWLLSQSERIKWDKLIKAKTKVALSNGKLGMLFFTAFIAVYREAAETVLFYSGLVGAASNKGAVFTGFVFGTAVLSLVCGALYRFNVKIPLRQFFLTTSVLMVGLAIIMAGKTVHELIEAGYFQPTIVEALPTVDLFGIYPSVETLGAQAGLLILGAILAKTMLGKMNRSQKNHV